MNSIRLVVSGLSPMALWFLTATAGCSGTTAHAGVDAAAEASGSTQCTSQAQCVPPPTSPPNCAEGACDLVTGTCSYAAKDEDGDQHTAANCKSTNGVVVKTGDDCNDHDPDIYLGHAEPCGTLPDGGAPETACAPGLRSCLSDGTETACENALFCPTNQTCVGSQCVGVCGPNQTQCSSDLSGVESCDPSGAWGTAMSCGGAETCVSNGGSDAGGGGSAICTGACAQGQKQCTPDMTGVQSCDGSGMFGPAVPCANTTCLPQGSTSADGGAGQPACGGSCAPNETQCTSDLTGVQSCAAGGVWMTTTACSNQTCVTASTGAACTGSCAPGQTRCSGNAVQECNGQGGWGPAMACVNTTCTAGDGGLGGSCGGACSTGQTTCSGNNLEQCANGEFASATACSTLGKTCVVSSPGSASCTGSCAQGATQCSGNELQTCSSAGAWAGTQNCTTNSMTCMGTPAACSGACSPNEQQACGNCSGGTMTCSEGAYGSCANNPCAPNSSAACSTCATEVEFQGGTHTCTTSCNYNGVECAPTSGETWTGYAQNATIGHQCGNAYPANTPTDGSWQDLFSGMVGCQLQSSGPGFSLPAGNYTATIAYEGYSSDTSVPVDIQLIVEEGTRVIAVGNETILPSNEVTGIETVNFGVSDSCGAGITLDFLISQPTYTGQGGGGFVQIGKETISAQ